MNFNDFATNLSADKSEWKWYTWSRSTANTKLDDKCVRNESSNPATEHKISWSTCNHFITCQILMMFTEVLWMLETACRWCWETILPVLKCSDNINHSLANMEWKWNLFPCLHLSYQPKIKQPGRSKHAILLARSTFQTSCFLRTQVSFPSCVWRIVCIVFT